MSKSWLPPGRGAVRPSVSPAAPTTPARPVPLHPLEWSLDEARWAGASACSSRVCPLLPRAGSGSGAQALAGGAAVRAACLVFKSLIFFCGFFFFLYFFFVILLFFNPPIGESRGTGARSQGKGWKNK